MLHKDLSSVQRRWTDYWHRENHDRPMLSLYAPLGIPGPARPKPPASLEERWLDIDYVLKMGRANIETTYYGGDAFPNLWPNLGPDIMGAICGGCDIAFGDITSWAIGEVTDWETHPPLVFDEKNIWWQRLWHMTERMVKDSHGDYLVGITDLHPGSDGLVSLRGPENLCLDLMDCPEQFDRRSGEMFAVYKQVFTRLSGLISGGQKGSTNWMGMWKEQDWYIVCSDFSCLISEDVYNTKIAPGIEAELDFLGTGMYHLDGPGNLRHLDRILGMEKLNGVQWVPGVDRPAARFWLDVLRKIQKAGKNIWIECFPEDVEEVCQALEPEGLNLVMYLSDRDTAERIERRVTEIYAEKRHSIISTAPAHR